MIERNEAGRQRPWSDRCAVMGIINVTPDSFSGDGLAGAENTVDQVLRRAEQFLEGGADILDIGGESTRPGAEPVSAAEERARVIPAVQAIADRFPDAWISVDTYKADVARDALDAGAALLNDVWAGAADPEMLPLAAQRGVPIVLMHNRAKWGAATQDSRLGGAYDAPSYGDFLAELRQDLKALAEEAEKHGVPAGNILLDPGIGFGKTLDQNLALVRDAGVLRDLGYPILLGPSRKNFIGRVLNAEKEERLMGTAAAVAAGVRAGADIVRVHDALEMVDVVRMTEAIMHGAEQERDKR